MFKKMMIGAAIAVTALSAPLAASAQSWGDRDRDGRYERNDRRGDRNRHESNRNRHDRYDRHDRRDDRRYNREQRRAYDRYARQERREYRRWQRGQTIPYGYRSNWYVRDYNRYGYAPPPRGYGYYRTDSGDIVLAAIATGVILSLLNE